MIAKPFIERFKQKNIKRASNHSIDDNKFALLFRLTNQISSKEKDIINKLYDIIFHIFNPSSIMISSINNGGLKVESIISNPALGTHTDHQSLINKPSSSICELVKKDKSIQLINDLSQDFSNDPRLKSLEAKSSCGFPIFNNQNEVITVISLFFTRLQPLTPHEQSLISTIIDRIGRERENPNIAHPSSQPKTNNQDEVEQKKLEIETANKTLESISYAISHDLRAPLRSIDSFSQILAEDYTNNLPEEALNYLGRIRRSTRRMSAMIDDLLWLSKVTRRKIEKQEVNLSKAASNIIEEIKEKHAKHKCEFTTDAHMITSADKNLVKIALQHLLGNAFKFSQHKEIIQISFTHQTIDNEEVYKITDNGCGFDMNYYDQLFEPFKKLNDDRDYSGTGIGLATVKRIIQRHGGKIWAESEPEEGTSVFFTLLGKSN